MTQNDRVLMYIDEFGSISQLEAFRDLGVMRLSARIWDIVHKMGIPIHTEIIKSKNRFGEVVHFTKYSREVDDGGMDQAS